VKKQSIVLFLVLCGGIALLAFGTSLRGGPATEERESPVWRIVQGAGVMLIAGSFVIWGLATFGGKRS